MAETNGIWKTYTIRGVYDGIYLRDDFLTGIALSYAEGEMARGRMALKLGDVDTAEAAFTDVEHLFVSNEAAEGLKKCAALRAKMEPVRRPTQKGPMVKPVDADTAARIPSSPASA